MNLQTTLAFEKSIVEKINKSKIHTLVTMGVLSETSSNDIANAIAEVNPISESHHNDIITKLCEINKEKHLDLKKITWDFFLKENNYNTKHADFYIFPLEWYSTNNPEYFKYIIDLLDEIVYYVNGESFTLLDLIYAVDHLYFYWLIIYLIVNETLEVYEKYTKLDKTILKKHVINNHKNNCQLFSHEEMKFIENLPQNT
jgi:hypothetical protein